MTCVPATVAHAPVLAALHAAGMQRGRAWSADEFARLLATPGAFAFLAPGEAPEGFVLGWTQADTAEILTIAVTPAARRRGRGAALLAAAVESARAAGAARIVLDVAADNAPARALYAAAGFAQIGVRKGYYDAGATDALILARDLS